MKVAFARHFAEGDVPVLAIGADAPGVDADVIAAAVRALGTCDVVLGPATDGGYYLIGLNRPAPALFDGIAWSTSRVLRQTVAHCRASGLTVARLPPLRDVDSLVDLRVLGLPGA